MRLERLHEKLPGRIHDVLDAAAIEAVHDLGVHVLGKRVGDGPRKHQHVAFAYDIHAVEQLLDLLLGDLGAVAVDHGHDGARELDVDAREALLETDEVAGDALVLKGLDEVIAGEATDNTHGDVHNVELVEQRGDVDAVATAVELLARGSVGEAHVEREGGHDVVNRGVERDGINQGKLLSSQSIIRSMMQTAAPRVLNTRDWMEKVSQCGRAVRGAPR